MGGELGNILQNIKEFYRVLSAPRPLPLALLKLIKALSPQFIYIVVDCLFCQVGCGAIGCELLKNFALLGIAGSANGMVVFIFILTFSGMFRHFDF